MARRIFPRFVRNWPKVFWERAESSFQGNDLECRTCLGRGFLTDPYHEGIPVAYPCDRCLGSGLILPRKRPAEFHALDGPDLAWASVRREDIKWPEVPWAWVVKPAGLGQLGHARCEGGVVAWVEEGGLLLGLVGMTDDAQEWLRAAYRKAFGADAEEVEFVLPWRDGERGKTDPAGRP
jgi:hypothetical protein